jgi:hypothetical protein
MQLLFRAKTVAEFKKAPVHFWKASYLRYLRHVKNRWSIVKKKNKNKNKKEEEAAVKPSAHTFPNHVIHVGKLKSVGGCIFLDYAASILHKKSGGVKNVRNGFGSGSGQILLPQPRA